LRHGDGVISIQGVGKPVPTKKKIDIERLKKQEPILFYEEIVLYEDELGDNGSARLHVRIVDI
jgi:hypothetical protein